MNFRPPFWRRVYFIEGKKQNRTIFLSYTPCPLDHWFQFGNTGIKLKRIFACSSLSIKDILLLHSNIVKTGFFSSERDSYVYSAPSKILNSSFKFHHYNEEVWFPILLLVFLAYQTYYGLTTDQGIWVLRKEKFNWLDNSIGHCM